MFKVKCFLVLILLLVMVQPGFSDETPVAPVQGVWKLVSYEVEIQSNGQKEFPMGHNPTGYVIFTPQARVFFMLTGEGRQPAKTDPEQAKLLSSLIAYTGTYRLEGDAVITKVQVAWNPQWIGTEQKRTFKVEGDRLQLLTPWRIMPNWPKKGMTRSIVTFERAQ